MKKASFLLLSISLFFSLLSTTGCTGPQLSDTDTNQETENQETETLQTDAEPGSWVPDTKGPWDGTIYLATSSDGLNFDGKEQLFTQAGVPNLLLQSNGDLILMYQYFSSTDEDLFDTITYSVSEDDGATWTDTSAIDFQGLP